MKQANAVCELAQNRPNEALCSLTNQARRAAVSVPVDLAEGLGRGIVREVARFAQIALDSLCELDTTLHLASNVEYGSGGGVGELCERLATLARRTSSFISCGGNWK